MKLKLINLHIENVKGIEVLDMNINKAHDIIGPNGIGKSTVLDTISWLLTGQSDLRNQKFDPTVIGKSNVETEAILKFEVDGAAHNVEISRRNEKLPLQYFVNGEKLGKSKYILKLEELLGSSIKELMNPFYILENLSMEETRKIIMGYLDVPTEDSIKTTLLSATGATDVQWTIAADNYWNKKTIKDRRNYSMGKLDTVKTTLLADKASLAEMGDEDTTILEVRRDKLLEERSKAEDGDAINEMVTKRNTILGQMSVIADENRMYETDYSNITNIINRLNTDIVKMDNEIKSLLTDASKLASSPIANSCLVCGHDLDEATKTAVLSKRDVKVAEINSKADALNKEKDTLKTKLVDAYANEHITKTKLEIDAVDNKKKFNELQAEESDLNIKIAAARDTSAITKIDAQLLEVNKQLSNNSAFLKDRIARDELKLTQMRSEIDDFNMALLVVKEAKAMTARMMKNQLNTHFDGIQIEVERTLKNGDTKPDFIVLIDGIPYKSLNTAAQFKAATTLTLGLQKLKSVDYPLLIDNTESITKKTWDETISLNHSYIRTVVKGDD